MHTTIEIPDAVYRKIKAKADLEGATVEDLILKLVVSGLEGEKKAVRTRFPLIRGKARRKLRITNTKIEEILLG